MTHTPQASIAAFVGLAPYPDRAIPCPVIPRMVRVARGDFEALLFLPADPVNAGNVACWDGCHNEASIEFYRGSRPARTRAEHDACAAAVRRYAGFMASIPAADRQPLVIRERMTPADRLARYSSF